MNRERVFLVRNPNSEPQGVTHVKRLVWLCALALPLVVFAQGKDEKKFTGDPKQAPGVNWQGQLVRATGAGAPDLKASNPAQARLGAERAALLDAMRNLLAQVQGIQIDATKKMGDAMADDKVKAKVEGVLRTYRVVGKRYFSDGGVEVDIEAPLALLTEVFDPDPTPQQLVAQAPAKPPEPAKDPKDPKTAAVTPPPAADKATGLVIDARGLKVTPALAPRLLDGAGKAVYSVDSLSADARKTNGVASYVQSLDEAKKSMKAGDKPLMVKASKATGVDLVLAEADIKKLVESDASFLAQGKVIIVLN